MNLYVLLRVIFHSLLVVHNLLALMAAAWSISVSRGHASPGAVLVILGCVAYVALCIMTWAEVCVPGTQLSRVRTEITWVPMVIIFQLIAAVVVTTNTINSVCYNPNSCVSLVVLSWLMSFSLLGYFLMVLAITGDHAKFYPRIWDESLLAYPWFRTPPPLPPKDDVEPTLPYVNITPPLSFRTQPSISERERERFPWVHPSSHAPSLLSPMPSSGHSMHGSFKYSFIPRWAKALRPVQRGKEVPFPVAMRHEQYSQPRRIDEPVSPTIYTENY